MTDIKYKEWFDSQPIEFINRVCSGGVKMASQITAERMDGSEDTLDLEMTDLVEELDEFACTVLERKR
jgi:hypothetical protein